MLYCSDILANNGGERVVLVSTSHKQLLSEQPSRHEQLPWIFF
jgi:hypothetical protein